MSWEVAVQNGYLLTKKKEVGDATCGERAKR